MKRIDLGQTISILANIGVVAGIVFLAIEIRNSNTQARITATQEVVSQRAGWREFIAGDENLSRIYSNGLRDYQALTAEEQQRFALLMESLLFKISGNISARNVGLVGLNPDYEARSIEGDLYRLLERPGFRQWLEQADLRGLPGNVRAMMGELDALRAEQQYE